MEARVAALERMAITQQNRWNILKATCEDLVGEVADLTESMHSIQCLREALLGVDREMGLDGASVGSLSARLRSGRTGVLLREVMQWPEFTFVVGRAVGLPTAFHIALSSKSSGLAVGMREILTKIAAFSKPQICIFGSRPGAPEFYINCTGDRYDVLRNTWEALPSMPTARQGCACAAAMGQLYVFGGYDGCSYLAAAECFNPHSSEWSTLAPMLSARAGCAAAVASGQICVAGGALARESLATIESFDTFQGIWERLPDMPSARTSCAAAAVRGSLFVVGGDNGVQHLAVAETFNPHLRTWEALASMPTPRHGCAAASARGFLFVFGGSDGACYFSSVERYCPGDDVWEVLADMPNGGCGGCAAAATGGMIYVFGGYVPGRHLASAACLDPESGTWKDLCQMPNARSSCTMAALNWPLSSDSQVKKHWPSN